MPLVLGWGRKSLKQAKSNGVCCYLIGAHPLKKKKIKLTSDMFLCCLSALDPQQVLHCTLGSIFSPPQTLHTGGR